MWIIYLEHANDLKKEMFFGPYKKYEEALDALHQEEPLADILSEDNYVDCRMVYMNHKKLLKEPSWRTSIWTRLKTSLSSVKPVISTGH
jgi:hypothetical protein